MHTFRRRHGKDIELEVESMGSGTMEREADPPHRVPHSPHPRSCPASQPVASSRSWSGPKLVEAGRSSTSSPMMTRSLRHVVIATSQSLSLDHARPAGNWNFDLQLGRQTNDSGWPPMALLFHTPRRSRLTLFRARYRILNAAKNSECSNRIFAQSVAVHNCTYMVAYGNV